MRAYRRSSARPPGDESRAMTLEFSTHGPPENLRIEVRNFEGGGSRMARLDMGRSVASVPTAIILAGGRSRSLSRYLRGETSDLGKKDQCTSDDTP